MTLTNCTVSSQLRRDGRRHMHRRQHDRTHQHDRRRAGRWRRHRRRGDGLLQPGGHRRLGRSVQRRRRQHRRRGQPGAIPTGQLRRSDPDDGSCCRAARRSTPAPPGRSLPRTSGRVRDRPGSMPEPPSISVPTRTARRTGHKRQPTRTMSAHFVPGSAGPSQHQRQPDEYRQPPANTVVFDKAGIFDTPRTITLSPSLGTLELSNASYGGDDHGPGGGTDRQRRQRVRVFQVDSEATATFSGLTISDGSSTGNGGGLYNDGGTTTLTGVTLSGNSATGTAAVCTNSAA